ncbi:hypothetical protein Tco_0471905 [Tanacetum coccineum]
MVPDHKVGGAVGDRGNEGDPAANATISVWVEAAMGCLRAPPPRILNHKAHAPHWDPPSRHPHSLSG